MPLGPLTLPGAVPTRQGRRSRLLYHWRARDLSLTALSGQLAAFSRASAGGAILDRYGRMSVPVHSQQRYEMVDLDGDGVPETAGLVLEPQRTNSALWSSDFTNAVWAGASDFTLSAAASILPGQIAQRHLNNNLIVSRSRSQPNGALSAGGDTVFYIVENVNALTTAVGLFDTTLSAFICLAEFTWATRTIAVINGAGTTFAVKLTETGPNGGPVYLLGVSATGTAGNVRRIYCYPTGVLQNGLAAIVHHGQLEGGALFPTSPVITNGSSATRIRDSFEPPINFGMQDLTVYLRYVSRGHEGHDASTKVLLALGQTGAATRFQIQHSGGSILTAALAGLASGSSGGVSVASAVPGTVVEVLAQLDYTLLTQTAIISLAVALNGGTPVTSTLSAATAVSTGFQGNALALAGIPGASTVDWSGTFMSAKVAAGLLSFDQIREQF